MDTRQADVGRGVVVNGAARTVPRDGSLIALLEEFGVEAASARGVAVAVNESVVRKRDWEEVRLTDGDRVEVVTAKQGG